MAGPMPKQRATASSTARAAAALSLGPLLALLALLVATPVVADELGAAEARELQRQGLILPLEQILRHARGHRDGRLLDVELEREHGRYVYELELLDDAGRVWELELDAGDGALIELERED